MPRRRREKALRFKRAAGVEVREVGNEMFLVAPRRGAIHQLDRVASGAWRALAEPRTADEIIALFCTAFPRAGKGRVAKDIVHLLAVLEESGLIVRA